VDERCYYLGNEDNAIKLTFVDDLKEIYSNFGSKKEIIRQGRERERGGPLSCIPS